MKDISNQIGAINTNKELIKNAQYGKDVRGALYLIANNLVSIANSLNGDLTTHDKALSAIGEVLNGLDVTIKNLASKTTVMHFDDTDTASLTISAGDYMAKLNQNGTAEYYQINNGEVVDAQAIEPIRICIDNGEVAYVPSNTGVINLPLSNLGFSKGKNTHTFIDYNNPTITLKNGAHYCVGINSATSSITIKLKSDFVFGSVATVAFFVGENIISTPITSEHYLVYRGDHVENGTWFLQTHTIYKVIFENIGGEIIMVTVKAAENIFG